MSSTRVDAEPSPFPSSSDPAGAYKLLLQERAGPFAPTPSTSGMVVAAAPTRRSASSLRAHGSAPLYEALRRFVERDQAPFYSPGHKGGRTLEPWFRDHIAALDLNNLPDTDTLH